MAFHFEKQNTTSTPYVLIDEEKSYLKIRGRSFHEDIVNFYKEINTWLDSYLVSDFKTLTFDCELSYLNSSTIKILLNIIMKMDKNASCEKKVIINWITADINEIVIECGEDFREEVTNLTFNIVIKKD